MAGKMWDGEYDSQSIVDLKDRVAALETPTVPGGTTTLTGVPQPGTPYVVAARVGKNGQIYATVRYTSLASTLRRFWVYHKKLKKNGTYGKPIAQRIIPTAANLAANTIEVELQTGLDPHRQYDLVLIESKLTDDGTNDGGNRDTNPDPYIEATAPGVPAGSSTALASIGALAGQPGNKVDNFCQNAKLKWNSNDWMNAGGTNDSGPTNAALNLVCAKWRYNVTNTQGLLTTPASINYWAITGAYAGTLTIGSNNPALDPCSRMQHAPYSPGDNFNVAFTALIGGAWTAAEQLYVLTISLYDEGTGVTPATTSLVIGGYASRTEWRYIQMPLVTCSTSWAPIGGTNAKQWVRWHLSGTLAAGHSLHVDKVLYSDQQGAWSANASDLSQDLPPSVQQTGSSSGTVGQGDQPGTFDPGVGGYYIPVAE